MVPLPILAQVLTHMKNSGLIQYEHDPHDGESKLILLTKLAYDCMPAVRKAFQHSDEDMIGLRQQRGRSTGGNAAPRPRQCRTRCQVAIVAAIAGTSVTYWLPAIFGQFAFNRCRERMHAARASHDSRCFVAYGRHRQCAPSIRSG